MKHAEIDEVGWRSHVPKRIRRLVRKYRTYFISQLRAGRARVKGAFVPTIIAAAFAAVSWTICKYLMGEPNPVFAPIATFLCLGMSRNRNIRKVVELGVGASLGVAVGGLVAVNWGFDWWQLFLLMSVMPLLGRMIDRSELTAFQMGIQSIVMASMITGGMVSASSGVFGRWMDALTGAVVALFATLILPINTESRPRRYAVLALNDVSRALRALGHGMAEGSVVMVHSAKGYLSATREAVTDGEAALASARETSRLNPVARRRSLTKLTELERILEMTDRLEITALIFERQARGMVIERGEIKTVSPYVLQVATIIDQVAAGIGNWERPTKARNAAVAIAGELAPEEVGHNDDWRSATLTSLLRAIVVDTLQLTGLSNAQARSTLAGNNPDEPEGLPEVEDWDRRSEIWGTDELPAIGSEDRRYFKKLTADELQKGEDD
ncbi:FUSC family protein [Propionimicrobium lymphophilum]|uniref:FUSC family protein n=1 Tax=Propionimicrobium TaxID=203133 RepID=UPI0003D79822|nr:MULTISPECIES: FUSC family protein [Propionimicrobium]ETJ97492.1 fusaric acid resistance protein-like protein [Propionimicrobium sp. BV2F7]MDK7710726.1 FUSC family protein [Propionimicrobium lymphophilum]MDK7733666.1 FUSC family protein [Propionimicrobium lymphophilum]